MLRPFIDPDYKPSEPSARLLFGGNRLERLSEDRAEDCVARALEMDSARLFGMAKGRVLFRFNGEQAHALHNLNDLQQFSPRMEHTILLGFDGDGPRLAVPLALNPDDENLELPTAHKLIDFRSIALQMLLPEAELGQVAQGAATLAWHATSRFCGCCGSKTQMQGGGVKRHCPQCKRDTFPRTDPVVIMLITSGDRCLLGRGHHFPPGMYSALAGFVEAGESIEMAVRRETFEESGLRVGKVRYHATQPWPFPHTLMIGCYGEALEHDIKRDEGELDDCRWFTRDEIREILIEGGPKNDDGSPRFFMPPKLAIANQLVTDWAAEA